MGSTPTSPRQEKLNLPYVGCRFEDAPVGVEVTFKRMAYWKIEPIHIDTAEGTIKINAVADPHGGYGSYRWVEDKKFVTYWKSK